MTDEITFDDLVRFVSGVPGFKSIPEQDLRDLVAPIVCISLYEAGQAIIRVGEPGDTLFMLYRGRVRVDMPQQGAKQQQFYIQSGEIFGEMALVSQAKRSADVIAVESCLCLTIDTESFQAIMKDHWRITRAVAGMIGERIVSRAAPKEKSKADFNSNR